MSDTDNVENVRRKRVRTTSNLTLEQLKHKRDMDRRAQRALRERTKTRLQELENELASLRASTSEKESQLNEELKFLRSQHGKLLARLARIRKIATAEKSKGQSRPEIDKHGVYDVVNSTISYSSESPISNTTSPRAEPVCGPDDPIEIQPPNSDDVHESEEQNHVENQPANARDFELENSDNRDGSGSWPMQHVATLEDYQTTLPFPRVDNAAIVYGGIQSQPAFSEMLVRHPEISRGDQYLDGSQAGNVNVQLSPSLVSPATSSGTHPSIQYLEPKPHDRGIFAFAPQYLPPTCPLDQILLDFLSSRKTLLANGTSIETLVGPKDLSVVAIVYPELAQGVHPLSRVMAEVLTTFSHVALPERIAFMYLMHGTMRWLIAPTKENYMQLPLWLRPTASQISIPHAAWIDNIPWPSVRDLLIEQPTEYPFEKFSEIYSHSVTIGWPFEAMDAVMKSPFGGGEELLLNPLFEKHIRKLKNWKAGPDFERLLPEAAASIE